MASLVMSMDGRQREPSVASLVMSMDSRQRAKERWRAKSTPHLQGKLALRRVLGAAEVGACHREERRDVDLR